MPDVSLLNPWEVLSAGPTSRSWSCALRPESRRSGAAVAGNAHDGGRMVAPAGVNEEIPREPVKAGPAQAEPAAGEPAVAPEGKLAALAPAGKLAEGAPEEADLAETELVEAGHSELAEGELAEGELAEAGPADAELAGTGALGLDAVEEHRDVNPLAVAGTCTGTCIRVPLRITLRYTTSPGLASRIWSSKSRKLLTRLPSTPIIMS